MHTCIIHLFHTGNLLASICAVKWHNIRKYGDDNVNVITIINCPGQSLKIGLETKKIIDTILISFGWNISILLTDEDIQKIHFCGKHAAYSKILENFKAKIDCNKISEFYFAHDVIGEIPELCMNAFPEAELIIFGDALGSLYDKELHLRLAGGIDPTINQKSTIFTKILGGYQKFNQFLTRTIYGGPEKHNVNKAVCILPMDQTGHCLDNKDLLIIPKEFVVNIFMEIKKSLISLQLLCNEIINHTNPPRFLFLLENFSEGGFLTIETEVHLYCDMVRKYIPPNSSLILKIHPLSVSSVPKMIQEALGKDYCTYIIDSKYSRYPVEFMYDLIVNTEILSFSYPCISILYLYEKSPMYLLNQDVINKYFPEKYHESYFNSNQHYTGQIKNLKNWDGESVLWRGNND